jgi:syntaxin 18
VQINRTAEKSLMEISELQTQLVNNLQMQSENIEQLEMDSLNTTENVGGGNKQLKKATQRKSTAKYVFYASCGLSLFLVVWDLVI